jgi:LmbE family N-acetylglucosaminyl deacetylase
MLDLIFGNSSGRLLRLLCLGAHSDDIEIGCGGTILKLAAIGRPVEICWVVFSSDHDREREACASAALFLKGIKRQRVIVKNFRNGFFPYVGTEIKEFFEELKQEFSPDVILTHYRHDYHQDHRTLCELTWNTFRNHMILEYEIPKYDGDLGSPNCFVSLDRRICRRKADYLCRVFGTQKSKHWFTPDTFEALMRLRGMESCSPTKFAEAFYARKLVIGSTAAEKSSRQAK